MTTYSKFLDIGLMDAEEAQRDYTYIFATAKTLLPQLNDNDLAIVVAIATNICPYCHENVRPCTCTLDE